MKNLTSYFFLPFLIILALGLDSHQVFSQNTKDELLWEPYSGAISRIVELSDGKLRREDVIQYVSDLKKKTPYFSFPETISDSLTLIPEIDLVSHDGSDSARYKYLRPGITNNPVLDFSLTPEWVNTAARITADSIVIAVAANQSFVARLASFVARSIVENDTSYFTAYILQEPQPQPFIFVSPNFYACSANGGSATFTVTHFNIAQWEAVINNPEWISVVPGSQTVNSIAFNFAANNTQSPRNGSIIIRDTANYSIADTIAIFQDAGLLPYLFVSPENNYIAPEGGVVDLTINSNFVWVASTISNPGNMVTNLSQYLTNSDTLTVDVAANTGVNPRTASIAISSGGLTDTISIFQSASYIILNPQTKVVPCTGETFDVNVITFSVSGIEISSKPDWIDEPVISNETITITVQENPGPSARSGIVVVWSEQNHLITDTLLVTQYSCNQPYILLSPRGQTASWDQTSLSLPFTINSNNINNLQLSEGAEWLEAAFNTLKDSLFVTTDTNHFTNVRQAQIKVFDAANPSIYDSVQVLQSGKLAYILIDPSFQSVSHEGGPTGLFTVHSLNVNSWEVIEDNLPGWIVDYQTSESGVVFQIASNPASTSRETTFNIRDLNDPTLTDSATIYQKAAPASQLLASPREQIISHVGASSVNFQITAVNVDTWETDTNSLSSWISQNNSGQELLSLNVSENLSLETRNAGIRIFDTSDPTVADTVYIYQHSALDTFLIAAPREQMVGHTGNTSLNFEIASANVTGWSVDTATLPVWIGLADTTFTQMTLNVASNPTLQSRQARVKIFVNDRPWINDSVLVYQYSALDTFLIIAPREQLVGHMGNTNLAFDVTAVNVSNWSVETATLPEWIDVAGTTFNQMNLSIAPNFSLQNRQGVVKILVDGQPWINDFVVVYQYSSLDTFLLVAPREQRVSHLGNPTLDFDVTAVNAGSWSVETSALPEWIGLAGTTSSQFTLSIAANTSLQNRQAKVKVYVDNKPWINDSVFVYQYSALDTFLLVAPREQRVSHLGDATLDYEVTAVNVENWSVETASLPGWISVAGTSLSEMTLNVEPNTNLQNRQAKVRVYIDGKPWINDSVYVYQYSALDTFLLAAPREQRVGHTGNPNLNFTVASANVTGWSVETATLPGWIDVAGTSLNQLTLGIEENTSLQTREAKVRIVVNDQPWRMDSVFVYQYSALDTFLLASPRERSVQFLGETIDFAITQANVTNWVIDPGQLPEWIAPGNSSQDNLRLDVQMNPFTETRNHTVFLYKQGNYAIRDSVKVYQFAALDPFILAAPREKKVPHYGNDSVIFNLTLVNVNEWEFSDTTLYQEWIDFHNYGDTLLLSISPNPDLTSRQANIVIQDTEKPEVRDSISIFQYSGLDRYILMEPREQMAPHLLDSIFDFKITAVNTGVLAYQILKNTYEMVDTSNIEISNSTLKVPVLINNLPFSREAIISVFDAENPNSVSDSVSIYQNYPYIILRPSAIDSIEWTETARKIVTYSNVASYKASKGQDYDWFHISKDSVNWTNNILELTGNDELFLRVDTNNNSFLRRSSYLKFEINNEIATEMWFDQNTRPGKFYPVSGKVFIQNNPLQPLEGVSVVLYDSIVKSNSLGTYKYQNVPENWIGTITPLIDTAWEIPYYFLPPRVEISGLGIIDTTEVAAFAAYKIEPAVAITPENAAICLGETLIPGDLNYPLANITDTYGSISYLWTSNPPDSVLMLNPTVLNPEFGPKVTTTYQLEINNFYRTAADNFTIVVNPLPETFTFDGQMSVCSNQSGVIYQVPNPQPGVYYQWQLDDENPGGTFANGNFSTSVFGNIAIINWGDVPGNYSLQLMAFNEFNCAAEPVIQNIEITGATSPPPTSVLRKDNDNMLYCTDTLANYYQWGWIQKNAVGELIQEYIIPDKNQWYCRLPDEHTFNPAVFYYFVITYFNENECGSKSFYNYPVDIEELSDQSIIVFPNPSNGIFTLRFGEEISPESASINIFNLSGQVIWQNKIPARTKEITIDLTKRTTHYPGIYMLRVLTKDHVFNSSIIIQ